MIRYHGCPISPQTTAVPFLRGRHALCSLGEPYQTPLVAENCQSFCLDNSAFKLWKEGSKVDLIEHHDYVQEWERHPGFDFHFLPDQIDGTEQDNDRMIASWVAKGFSLRNAVPVWHLHESLDRLAYLIHCARCGVYNRVAIGSSGQWATPGKPDWWQRMDEVRKIACDELGVPHCKLHGLRMMDPTIFAHIPFASVDSATVARNVGLDVKMPTAFKRVTGSTRALVFADRCENHAAAVTWSQQAGTQKNLELIG